MVGVVPRLSVVCRLVTLSDSECESVILSYLISYLSVSLCIVYIVFICNMVVDVTVVATSVEITAECSAIPFVQICVRTQICLSV